MTVSAAPPDGFPRFEAVRRVLKSVTTSRGVTGFRSQGINNAKLEKKTEELTLSAAPVIRSRLDPNETVARARGFLKNGRWPSKRII